MDALGAHQYAGCCTFKLLQDGAELPLPRAGRGEVRSAVVPWRRAYGHHEQSPQGGARAHDTFRRAFGYSLMRI